MGLKTLKFKTTLYGEDFVYQNIVTF